MRAYFVKQTPKVIYYRDYRKFSNDLFRNDILPAQALTDTLTKKKMFKLIQ